MFLCKIFFENEYEKTILTDLLSHRLIKHYSFSKDYVCVVTRKLWKFYWFNRFFKKFPRKYAYSFISGKFFVTKSLPNYLSTYYEVKKEMVDWYTFKISIDFSNINDIWKIMFLTL